MQWWFSSEGDVCFGCDAKGTVDVHVVSVCFAAGRLTLFFYIRNQFGIFER